MKTYKGWEILKMTEEDKFTEGSKIESALETYVFDRKTWVGESGGEAGISEFLGMDFNREIKPVSFMEALNSDKKVRVEHPLIDTWDNLFTNEIVIEENFNAYTKGEYLKMPSLMTVLGYKLSKTNFKEVINNGKWYIEEE